MTGTEATSDATATTAESTLDEMRAGLLAVINQIASRYPGEPRVTIDRRYEAYPFGRPAMRSRGAGWEYNVRLPAPPNAADILTEHVIPELTEAGWRVTDRSTEREVAYQFTRDGTNLGVHIARDGEGDVVIGGSTPVVSAVPSVSAS